MIELGTLVDKIKKHPDFPKAGIILCHNGIVRETSRDGRKVTGLRVSADREKLDGIIAQKKRMPGIVDILVEIDDTRDLSVGDDVMYIVVAGDIRENVITALSETLNEVKRSVTDKTEFFA